jgi:hypothetical protein
VAGAFLAGAFFAGAFAAGAFFAEVAAPSRPAGEVVLAAARGRREITFFAAAAADPANERVELRAIEPVPFRT